jgi:glycosyltransferase involved in cell wall biosynthesis
MVSVVVPCLNAPLIGRVVAALQAQTRPPDEIIVVGRDEPGYLAQSSGVCFLDTGRQVSPARARNLGAAEARGAVLCFLDDDCMPDVRWLERLLRWQHNGMPVVGGGVRLPDDGYWTLCDNLAALPDALWCTAAGPRPHLPTLNLSIRRDLFWAMGGFDEVFPQPTGEDADLSFRLRQQGYLLLFEPRAAITHCSARRSARTVWAHLRGYGAWYTLLQERYADVIGAGVRRWLRRRWPLLLLLLAPMLAVLDSVQPLRRHRCLRRYWYALPGMIWGRLGWYVGFVRDADRVARIAEAAESRVQTR